MFSLHWLFGVWSPLPAPGHHSPSSCPDHCNFRTQVESNLRSSLATWIGFAFRISFFAFFAGKSDSRTSPFQRPKLSDSSSVVGPWLGPGYLRGDVPSGATDNAHTCDIMIVEHAANICYKIKIFLSNILFTLRCGEHLSIPSNICGLSCPNSCRLVSLW